MGRLETEQTMPRIGGQGPKPNNNIESALEATSPDYMMDRQNSLEASHDNFCNQQEPQSLHQKNSIPKEEPHLGVISQLNPLTVISNPHAAQDLLRIENDQRKSLSSAAVRVTFENDRRN